MKPLYSIVLSVVLASSAGADVLTVDVIGQSFVNTGSGFGTSVVPGFLRVGVIQGQIDPGNYRSALEFDIRSIAPFATINSATLTIDVLGTSEQQGTVFLSAYFGNGQLDATDVGFTTNDLVLGQDAGPASYDVTSIFRSFYNIGTPFLGFSARQDPAGVCLQPTFGSCAVALGSIGSQVVVNPTLQIDYTPFSNPPDPEPVPEPGTWSLLAVATVAAAFSRRVTRRF